MRIHQPHHAILALCDVIIRHSGCFFIIHKDRFAVGYQFDTEDRIVALGEGGYIL
jgi:hypothetical protein